MIHHEFCRLDPIKTYLHYTSESSDKLAFNLFISSIGKGYFARDVPAVFVMSVPRMVPFL